MEAGLPAAIAAGTLFQLFQWAYLSFQFGVAKYNAIYGSFAALPLFLVWLQISRLIVLFGAELLFSIKTQVYHSFQSRRANTLILQYLLFIRHNYYV